MTTTIAPYESIVSSDDRPAWLAARNTGLGASDIPSLFGAGFKSAVRLWAEKTGRLEPEDLSDNDAVRWGNLLERLVAEEYERKTKRWANRGGVLLRSLDHKWAVATPDYWIVGGGEGGIDYEVKPPIPLQIKTTSAYKLKDWADGPPEAVNIQVHAEMLVTGALWASVAVLVGGQRFMWADVPRDESLIEQIIERGRQFWDCVVNETWPDFDGSEDETAALGQMWKEVAEGEGVALPIEAQSWAVRLDDLKAEMKALEEEETVLKNTIRANIGDAEYGYLPDGSGWSYKSQTRKSYTVKESTFRVLRRIKA